MFAGLYSVRVAGLSEGIPLEEPATIPSRPSGHASQLHHTEWTTLWSLVFQK
jgi:hypothetical protein